MVSQFQGFRLSPQQRYLWQQQKGAYRACCAVIIDGQLNSGALRNAVQVVVRRHEILRTTYQRVPGIKFPVQYITDADAITWQAIDLQSSSQQNQADGFQKLVRDEVMHASATEQEPALRIFLVTRSKQKYMCLMSLPALSADNKTFQSLLQEISNAYAQAGEPTEEAAQYIQFSEWQHELLESDEAHEGKNYWAKQHRDKASNPVLPSETLLSDADIATAAIPYVFTLKLPAGFAVKIDAISQQFGIAANIFLLACWQTLLWRLTNADTICINTAFSGRKHKELLDILGVCTKSLPIYCRIAANTSIAEIGRQLVQVVNDADDWLEYFVEELEVEPPECLTELPVSFEFEEWPVCYRAIDVIFSMQRLYADFKAYKIKLSCIRQESDLMAEFFYHSAIFSSDAIQRLAGQFYSLLLSVVANPTISINNVDILSADEHQQLLIELNKTSVNYPPSCCIQQSFEEQVTRTPDSVAVTFEQCNLTYAELNARANQLAYYLQSLGIGPDVMVAAYLGRSLEMIIGLLGILKAGGTYIPIDPAYPLARIAFILENFQEGMLLTSKQLVTRLPDHLVRQICIEADWNKIAQESKVNPICRVFPEQLAYVIYTSGSTGTPKGVMISQQALFNYVRWCQDFYEVRAGSGTAVHSSIGFDLTVTSLFAPLLVGRTAFLASEKEGIEGLLEVLRHRPELSLLKITPAHLDLLTHQLSEEDLPYVARVLVIGGEALSAESLTRWRKAAPTVRLINEYGPTETTVGCCIYEVKPEDPQQGMVPIGGPISNIQLYILDKHLQPVPIGLEGDLYIGGTGMARGYIGQPDLTAERFIATTLGCKSGIRLYKSGDRARYQADATIEYLGRRDEQVKLRGYRIELGEIEVILGQHPAVCTNAVVLQKNEAGDKRLVAYVVVNSNPQISASQEDLHSYLQGLLPDYMVPADFVLVEALPLTPHGKVDRQALSIVQRHQSKTEAVVVAARTPLEELISVIWCEVLEIPTAGIHDDFFTSGGHSLLATQLISRIRTMLQVELPLQSMFRKPTIAKLATSVESALRKGESIEAPPLEHKPYPQTLPLSFAQQRLWFLTQLEPESIAYLIPHALPLPGQLNQCALEWSLQELVQRHESLRTTFPLQSGYPVQRIHSEVQLLVPLVDLGGLAQEEREDQAQQLAEQEKQQSCNLATGPLLRVWLLRLAQEEHVLLVTMHHIITDGWSQQIFDRELDHLYQAAVAGVASALPPLPIQYADFALWQRQWLQGERLQSLLDYWTLKLGGAPLLQLPIDYPYPSEQRHQGTIHYFVLSVDLSKTLLALSRQEGVTLFILLLAAFQVLLYRYTGQTDLVVGTDIASRNAVETETVIGFFINLLALRTDLSGKSSFRDVLFRVRETVFEAYTYQDTPFELLVEKLILHHTLERMPLVQALFVLQNLPSARQMAATPVVSLEREPTTEAAVTFLGEENRVSKFDMSLFMQEKEGRLLGGLNYRLDLFKPKTIATIIARFGVLLQSIVKAPETSIDQLEFFTPAERMQREHEEKRLRSELYTRKDERIDLSEGDFV